MVRKVLKGTTRIKKDISLVDQTMKYPLLYFLVGLGFFEESVISGLFDQLTEEVCRF